jgi:hypothetical protein
MVAVIFDFVLDRDYFDFDFWIQSKSKYVEATLNVHFDSPGLTLKSKIEAKLFPGLAYSKKMPIKIRKMSSLFFM